MKKNYFLIAMLFGVTISTVACKKCQTCTDDQSGYETEVCREGAYSTPQLYDAYIRSLENSGYTCK